MWCVGGWLPTRDWFRTAGAAALSWLFVGRGGGVGGLTDRPFSRLWDVETGQELLLQEGHYKETHAIAFQVGSHDSPPPAHIAAA